MIGFAEMVKGQDTQSLLTAMLENAGYRVSRLGVEEQLSDVKYLDAEKYAKLELPSALRLLPDLLVAAPDLSVARLVEVKYRRRLDAFSCRALAEKLEAQFRLWPGTTVVIFLSESFWDDRGYIQDHVRGLRAADLQTLRNDLLPVSRRWEQLPMLHQALPGLKSDNYLTQADYCTSVLMALGDL